MIVHFLSIFFGVFGFGKNKYSIDLLYNAEPLNVKLSCFFSLTALSDVHVPVVIYKKIK